MFFLEFCRITSLQDFHRVHFRKAFCFYMHGVSIKILDLHRFTGVHFVRVIEWSNVWWLSEMCPLTDRPRLLGRSRGWVLSTSDTNRKGNIQWFPKKLCERQTFDADTEYVYGGFPKQVFWLYLYCRAWTQNSQAVANREVTSVTSSFSIVCSISSTTPQSSYNEEHHEATTDETWPPGMIAGQP